MPVPTFVTPPDPVILLLNVTLLAELDSLCSETLPLSVSVPENVRVLVENEPNTSVPPLPEATTKLLAEPTPEVVTNVADPPPELPSVT